MNCKMSKKEFEEMEKKFKPSLIKEGLSEKQADKLLEANRKFLDKQMEHICNGDSSIKPKGLLNDCKLENAIKPIIDAEIR